MTNVTISGLPPAAPLSGKELVPIVQDGVTSHASIASIPGTYIDARDYDIDPTGANDSSVGGNLAIIDAINQKKRLIWPSGVFMLDRPLLAFINGNEVFQMYGQGGTAGATTRPFVSSAHTSFYTNSTNLPAIIINIGTAVILKDFSIVGKNAAPSDATRLITGPSANQADYISPNCQNGRYAPYCGIAIDPFTNSTQLNISGLTQSPKATVTVNTGGLTNPFVFGQSLAFSGLPSGSMPEINNLTGIVVGVGGSSGAWAVTVDIDSSGFSPYTGGGLVAGLPFNTGGSITGITQATQAVVTVNSSNALNPFMVGEKVYFSNVLGMVEIDGKSGVVVATGGTPNAWQITVDIDSSAFSAFSASPTASAIASDAYTELGQYYRTSFANRGTYGCIVENVNIDSFMVGIAVALSGNSTLGADLTFRNVAISNCDVGYAIGEGESRNVNVECGNITRCRTALDGLRYGTGAGTPPQLFRINLGNLYRIFAFGQSSGNFTIENCYAESIKSLGQYGFGGASSSIPLTFIGGDYKFGNAAWTMPPLLLETWGPTTFLGTSLQYSAQIEIDALNFIMPAEPIFFNHCTFSGTATPNVPSHIALTIDAGRAGGGYAKFLDCWVNGAIYPGGGALMISNDLGRSSDVSTFTTATGRLSAIYQTYRVSDGINEYIYLPNGSVPAVTVFGVTNLTLTSNSVTFNCSRAAQLLKGDILFWKMLRQGYSLIQWTVPALKITSIDGTGFATCALLFDPTQYDVVANQTVKDRMLVVPAQWAPAVPLTCTTNGTTTLANVSPTTILQTGDFVVGSGIPENTRVVTVSAATGTLEISQAATASATNVALYFGQLNKLGLTPLS